MKNNSAFQVFKVKKMEISAGRPIAFLGKKAASDIDISVGERISISYKNKKTIAVVDLAGNSLLNYGEIALSNEILQYLGAGARDCVKVSAAPHPESLPLIMKKMKGFTLSYPEIKTIIQDIVSNTLTEAEVAYFVSSVYEQKMSLDETISLTKAIFETGEKLTWNSGLTADKHSIGGIPGNRTTPIVVSICASCNIIMPKTSSRAITSAAGTADVVETLTNVNLSLKDIKRVIKKTNACLAWGGSLGLAPADDKLIRVERMLRVDPESQLIASILAKKLAAGSKTILLDIPCGKGAKVSYSQAKKLKSKFQRIGKHFSLNLKIVLTDGSQPIGNGIGPNLEMRDVLSVLQRRNSPQDLEKKSIMLSGIILEMLGKCSKGKGQDLALDILNSGLALQKFEEILEAQGRKHSTLPLGPHCKTFNSEKSGKVASIENNSLNMIGRLLGCPFDKSAGIYIYKHKHDLVSKGEPLFTLYSESESKLKESISFLKNSEPFLIS